MSDLWTPRRRGVLVLRLLPTSAGVSAKEVFYEVGIFRHQGIPTMTSKSLSLYSSQGCADPILVSLSIYGAPPTGGMTLTRIQRRVASRRRVEMPRIDPFLDSE